MTKPITSDLRREVFSMLLENVEDTDELDIVDQTGSFTTYRVEYLVNDILALIQKAREELLINLENDLKMAMVTSADRVALVYWIREKQKQL